MNVPTAFTRESRRAALNCLTPATVFVAAILAVGSETRGAIYVSNLAETYDAGFLSNGTLYASATAFTTDGAGYTLNGVTLSAQANTVGHAEVRIRSDAGGLPGDFLESLGTQTVIDGLQNLTYPSSGLVLAPNTTYWITAGETGSGDFYWTGTLSTAETSPGSWTIGNQFLQRDNGGASWTNYGYLAGRFSVDASSNDFEWVNPDNGSWSNSANWSSGTIPNSVNANVLFGSAATQTMSIAADINVTVNSITFNNSDFNYNVAGAEGHKITLAGDAVVDVQSGTHSLGFIAGTNGLVKAGPGTLVLNSANTLSGVVSVNEGTLELIPTTALQNANVIIVNPGSSIVSGDTVIGQELGSDVTAYVTGSGSLGAYWTTSDDFTVGYDGKGTLNIQSGGVVSNALGEVGRNAGSEGTVDISSAGSSWTCANGLHIGSSGTGLVRVRDGGELHVDGDIVVNRYAGGNGQLIVVGTGTTAETNGELRVADEGIGLMRVENGAVVNSASGSLARDSASASGTAYVDGAGAVWNIDGDLSVGVRGSGDLQIRNGGTVSVGNGAGSVAMAVELGSSAQIRIGDGGGGPAGSLAASEVTGGLGTANFVFDHAEPNYTFAPVLSGTLSVFHYNSGTTILTGSNTYTGTTNIESGKLIVNGTHTGGGEYTVNAGGTLGGSGTINAPVTVYGTLAPGNSPGILTIDGDYMQASTGTLQIEVGGLTPGTEHDKLVVTGTASLAGRLEAPIINGFVPALNDEITFLTAGLGVTGKFEALSAPGLANANPNVAIQVEYNSNDVRLRFVEPSHGIQFNGQAASVDWDATSTWTTATVPDTTNVITLQNLVGGAQRIEVQSDNARVHELTVTSGTDPVTVAIHNGVSLSATNSVTVGDQGIVELGTSIDPGGILVSAEVAVKSGGRLSGNGTVEGDLNVGIDAGPQTAVLSPGFAVGHIEVQGNLQQGSHGTLLVDIVSASSFDTVDVTGSATLGGTLKIDASNLTTVVAGTLYPIVTAGNITGTFDSVESTGDNNVYFIATTLGGGAGASVGSGESIGGSTVYAEILNRGDMNGDQIIDNRDFDLFAFGLMNRSTSAYFGKCDCDILPQQGGDFSGNGRLDFDDIAGFQNQISGMGMSSAGLRAAIDRYLTATPEPGSAILAILGGTIGSMVLGSRRRERGARSPTARTLVREEELKP